MTFSGPTTRNHFFLILLISILSAEGSLAQDRPERKAAALTDQWIRQLDSDGDGMLTRSEARGPMQRFFDRNDGDGNGKLDEKELRSLAERLTDRAATNRREPGAGSTTMPTEQLLAMASDDLTILPDLAYREGEDRAWKLDLVMPKERGDKPRAALVFVHGGGWRNGDKRKATFLGNAIAYARKGYVCITVNYRLIHEAPFPACIEDVKNAVRWLRANAETYHVDPDRIGGFGNSAGAHLVSMLGLATEDAGLEGDGPYREHSSLLQAVCASAPPTDFSLFDRDVSVDPRFQGVKGDAAELARLCFPITHVREDAPPFLIIHGTDDRIVDIKHGDKFVEALKAAGAQDVTYLRIDGAGHGVFNERKEQTQPAMEDFFARTLRGE